MDNALQGLEEANVAAEQGKRYFMDALKRAKSMRKNRLHRRPVSELCVFDDFEKSDQALMFEHVLKQRKELKRQILRSYPLLNKRPRSNDPVVARRTARYHLYDPSATLLTLQKWPGPQN